METNSMVCLMERRMVSWSVEKDMRETCSWPRGDRQEEVSIWRIWSKPTFCSYVVGYIMGMDDGLIMGAGALEWGNGE